MVPGMSNHTMVSGHSALHGLQGPGQSQGYRDEMDFRVMWDAAGLRVFHSEGSMLSSQYKQMYTSVPHGHSGGRWLGNHPDRMGGSFNSAKGPSSSLHQSLSWSVERWAGSSYL